MTPKEFIAAILPAALASQKITRIPAPFVVAQAALESGWGTSLLSVRGYNLFGVKADASWKGAILAMPTKEFLHGKWVVVTASWRKYPTWLACINDHSSFLTDNPRYKAAFNSNDPVAFTRAVAAAGYATDPDYAHKVISIIQGHSWASAQN